MGDRTCTVQDCDRKHYGRGFCYLHYKRMRSRGTTDAPAAFVPKACAVDDCERQANVPGSARGWCGPHYQRWQRWGDPTASHVPVVGVAECSIEGCPELVTARGWCSKHWTRWRRYGDPTKPMPGEVVDGRRICPKCNVDKPLAESTKSWCKSCVAANMRRRREDPREKQRMAAYSRRYSVANPGLQAERAKSWRDRNPDLVRALTAERRARQFAAKIETFQPREVFDRDGWVCGICREDIPHDARYPDPLSVSLDHVIPLSRGGTHERSNCQAAHLRCNLRKGARLIA